MTDGPAFDRHRAADDHRTAHAQGLEDAGQRFAQVRARHTDQGRSRPRRVQQRAEEVEDGALAAFGAKLARGDDVPEGRMILRRKEEREAMLPQRRTASSGPRSKGIPSASITSALPIGEVLARCRCLATRTPAAAPAAPRSWKC